MGVTVELKARKLPLMVVQASYPALLRGGAKSPSGNGCIALRLGYTCGSCIQKNGNVQLCGDYPIITINQAAKVDKYLLPRIKDLLASLSRGQQFTKLDLKHATSQSVLPSLNS